jgi:uncharacterized membrane protein HdeD (DUF308 family)
MATGASTRDLGWAGLGELKRSWGWFLAMGIALIILGVIALTFSILATVATVMVIGWLLAISGIVQAVHAFGRRPWSGLFLDLFSGVLSFVVGLVLVFRPLAGAEALTLLIAVFLFVSGVFRIAASLAHRFHNFGWLLLNGIINVLLGAMILWQWPVSGLWVIGLFVGIDMLMNGWSAVMLSMAARSLLTQTA